MIFSVRTSLALGLAVLLSSACGTSRMGGESDSAKKPAESPDDGKDPAGGDEGLGGSAQGEQSGQQQQGGKVPGDGATTTSGAAVPVLAFLGGYTSCGKKNGADDPTAMALAEPFTAIKAKVAQTLGGTPPASVLSCYSTDYANVRYVTSTTGDKVHLDDVDGFVDAVEQLALKAGGPVFIVGHSYGGWTAMYLATRLDQKVKLGGVVTLDPISKVECTPDKFISTTLGLGGGEGCQRAPADFTAQQVSFIAERTPSWLNYYQTDVAQLHSGEIQGAKNSHKQYSSGGFQPHSDVAADPAVLSEISALILGGLQPAAAATLVNN